MARRVVTEGYILHDDEGEPFDMEALRDSDTEDPLYAEGDDSDEEAMGEGESDLDDIDF